MESSISKSEVANTVDAFVRGPHHPVSEIPRNSLAFVTQGTVIIVSYMLPLSVARADDGSVEIGWDDERFLQAKKLQLAGTRIFYVGCIQLDLDVSEQEE